MVPLFYQETGSGADIGVTYGLQTYYGSGAPWHKEEIENTDGTGARLVQQIQADAFYAVQDILSVEGTMKNSTALRAMQQANLQAEKEIAVILLKGFGSTMSLYSK